MENIHIPQIQYQYITLKIDVVILSLFMYFKGAYIQSTKSCKDCRVDNPALIYKIGVMMSAFTQHISTVMM